MFHLVPCALLSVTAALPRRHFPSSPTFSHQGAATTDEADLTGRVSKLWRSGRAIKDPPREVAAVDTTSELEKGLYKVDDANESLLAPDVMFFHQAWRGTVQRRIIP